MNTDNAAVRQDLIENSVDHQVSTLTSSAASPGQLETLLNSELDHDLIECPANTWKPISIPMRQAASP